LMVYLVLLQNVVLKFLYLFSCLFLISAISEYFSLWKQAAIVHFKKCESSSAGNYGPTAILNKFPSLFKFDIPDHVSYFLKSKLKPF
jgi:hypothetical protein